MSLKWDNWSPEYWQSPFNALTKSNIPAENYPFCTIDPNSGLVQFPLRLDKLDNMINPKAKVEAIMEFRHCRFGWVPARSRPRQSISSHIDNRRIDS